MTSEAKKIAKLRLIKRIGIIGLVTSSAVGLVFLILSLLPQGDAAFTMRIDNPALIENSNFQIFATEEQAQNGSSKDSVTYLAGEPMGNVGLTDAKAVEDHLKNNVSNFVGNTNMVNESGKELAMVYTLYLTNTTEEDVYIQYAVRLDAFKESSEKISAPIEYFRVLVQTEEVGSPETLSNRYYGQPRSGRNPEYVYDSDSLPNAEAKGSGREPIFTKTYEEHIDDPETGKWQTVTHVLTDLVSEDNDGYSENFVDYKTNNNNIVVSEVKIPVGKVLRYTFVAYFDGTDIDSYVRALSDDYLLISLHFGV